MPAMNTRSRIIAGAVGVVAVVAIAALVGPRFGVVRFSSGSIIPSVSFAKLINHMPSLERPVNFPADFSAEAHTLWNNQVAKDTSALKKDPTDVATWLNLAIMYRMVGDYDGAVEIWKYISANYPKEAVSLHNLGEYYFHTAKDYARAEEYYRASITIAPQFAINYTDLYEMYRYVYTAKASAASEALKEGIAHVSAPEAIDLAVTLAGYYRDIGDIADARTYFMQARAGAKAAHNAGLIYQIDQQLTALPK